MWTKTSWIFQRDRTILGLVTSRGSIGPTWSRSHAHWRAGPYHPGGSTVRITLPIAALALAIGLLLPTAATQLEPVETRAAVQPLSAATHTPYRPGDPGLGPIVL